MTERSDHAVGRRATPLTRAQASTIVDAARAADLEPLTVAVLDGNLEPDPPIVVEDWYTREPVLQGAESIQSSQRRSHG